MTQKENNTPPASISGLCAPAWPGYPDQSKIPSEWQQVRYFDAAMADKIALGGRTALMELAIKLQVPNDNQDELNNLVCNIIDNLGDMPISEEWAHKTSKRLLELVFPSDNERNWPTPFDMWSSSPYYKVLMNSIENDYVVRSVAESQQREILKLREALADKEAEQVLDMISNGYAVRKCPVTRDFLMNSANEKFVWRAERTEAPYCDATGITAWFGASAIEALLNCANSLTENPWKGS